MTLGPLPHTVEVRTLAARRVVIEGALALSRMPRLVTAIVAADDGPARVYADFNRDEEGRYILDLSVNMVVSVACQRCMSAMTVELNSHSQLAALWSDEQAEHLPARYDPLVTGDTTDLWEVVEDELLLAMPPFSYHGDPECGAATGFKQDEASVPSEVIEAPEKENPFSVLAALKGKGIQSD